MSAFLLTSLLFNLSKSISIVERGAIANKFDAQTCLTNANAFMDAISYANSSTTDRQVLVPGSQQFCIMPVYASFIYNVTITFEGDIFASAEYQNWTLGPDGKVRDVFAFDDSKYLLFNGKGTVDGQGYEWWIREIEVKNVHGRPHLFTMQRCQYVEITETKYQNSPQFHFRLYDIDSFEIHDMEIYVDVWKQKQLTANWIQQKFEGKPYPIPDWLLQLLPLTFPLNTDGIDPAGTNVNIYNVVITNFDDAVAVKPSNRGGQIAQCSEGISVRNATVYFGVGMTIGSVPPNDKFNCVRNVNFTDVTFYHPIKGIYIKTNPGNHGSGIISDITYENIWMHNPIWWAIYIGPQQQEQPDGAGPGCMLYPLTPCETQPRVPIENVRLRNVHSTGGILPSGIIRCNETNPCHGFEFTNVTTSSLMDKFGYGYITENIYGVSENCSPDPNFKSVTRVVEWLLKAVEGAFNSIRD